MLLDHGADPNLPEPVAPHGGALYEAIAGQHWDVVRVLLGRGANPNGAVESSGDCVWRAKRDHAPAEIQNLLAEKGGVYTAEMACYDGDVAHIEKLLKADPHTEIWPHLPTDNEELVNLVLRYAPDVLTRKVFDGASSVERARWLFAHGMNPSKPNWLGITPLHRFAARGDLVMAELVLEHGAPIDTVDSEYDATPLGWAVRLGRSEMADWLRARGASR